MVDENKLSKEEELRQSALLYIEMKKDPFLFIKTMW
jgi:hypothetical protein